VSFLKERGRDDLSVAGGDEAPMWAPTVVVGAAGGKHAPPVPFAEDQDAVVSSALAVLTKRSAY
jgi:hypothetical protein